MLIAEDFKVFSLKGLYGLRKLFFFFFKFLILLNAQWVNYKIHDGGSYKIKAVQFCS